MERVQFDAMVQRLEDESARSPRTYLAKVALLAVLGLALLAMIVGLAASGLLVLVGLAVALLLKGGTMWLWLLKLGKLAALLLVPLWLVVKSSVQALLVRIPAPQGREITRTEAPALFAALDDMRRRLRGPKFHHVLVDDEMNASVLQRPAFGLFGWPRNHLVLAEESVRFGEDQRDEDAVVRVVGDRLGHRTREVRVSEAERAVAPTEEVARE